MNCKSLIRQAIVMLCSGVSVANAQNSDDSTVRTTPIRLAVASQPIAAALNDFARQSGLHVVIGSEVAAGVKSAPVKGTYTPEAALQQLLMNTGLRYEYLDSQTVAVLEKEKPRAEVLNGMTFRVAQAGEAVEPGISAFENPAQDSSQNRDQQTIDEIIVTATKRQERLIDVPQSVTVLSAEALTEAGALQFRDYADTVPGLSFQTEGAGTAQISLRGVSAGKDAGPTVGIYVDDVPFGSSTSYARASTFTLDAALFDVEKIEVLRGPQGTLYGASTMGGLLKYVTRQPDATSFRVDAKTGVSSTQHGDIGYHGAVAVNAPIVDERLALRASGYYSRDGGYIDNIALGDKDVNGSRTYGGRVDMLFTPTETLAIRLNGFLQDIAGDGTPHADFRQTGMPADGTLEQRRLISQWSEHRFRLASATISYDMGPATLISISSYQTARSEMMRDQTVRFMGLCTPLLARPCTTVANPFGSSTDKFTQEVRLTSEDAQVIEWLIGGFYTHETSRVPSALVARDSAGQPLTPVLLGLSIPSRYEELALFGDLTWRLTDKFDMTGGVRLARNRTKFEQIGSGVLALSAAAVSSTDDVLTYLANTRYHFSKHVTGYLRYATGYRPGGPNYAVVGADPTFEADRLRSYELGLKAETSDRRFGLDVAGYYIDWDNLIIGVTRSGFGVTDNAPGGAAVRGAELSLTGRPVIGLTATGAIAYQNAELSASDVSLGAAKGDRLPGVPRITASVSADYEFPVSVAQSTVGATLRFMDDRIADFENNGARPQYHLPDYFLVDLRAGITLGSANLQLYVRNLTDQRGQLLSRVEPTNLNPLPVGIVQPRTIGLTVSTSF